MGVKRVYAYGYSERQFKEIYNAISQKLKEHNIKSTPAEWPHISIVQSKVDVDKEKEDKIEDFANKNKATYKVDALQLFDGKFTNRLWIVLELEKHPKFLEVYNFIEDLIGKENVVQYEIRPHTSIMSTSMDDAEKVRALADELKEVVKKYSYPIKVDKVLSWGEAQQVNKVLSTEE